ncbi:MAG: hypothetical protein R3C13_05430 [Hyphomonas sp.]|uniref:hypothetical protein n=1 Tax=Hyphomonas sp. TaxID=87 RepID=UPI003528CF78
MLPDFDKNAAYIWAVYAIGASAILLTALIVILKAKASKAALAKAEARIREEDGK